MNRYCSKCGYLHDPGIKCTASHPPYEGAALTVFGCAVLCLLVILSLLVF